MPEPSQTATADHLNELLDQALVDTFPASDVPALTAPRPPQEPSGASS